MSTLHWAGLLLLAGGAFGVCFISLALMLLPKLGASGFIALALAGQVVASLVLDHFGWVWVGGAGNDVAAGVWGGVVIGWSGVDSVQRYTGQGFGDCELRG